MEGDLGIFNTERLVRAPEAETSEAASPENAEVDGAPLDDDTDQNMPEDALVNGEDGEGSDVPSVDGEYPDNVADREQRENKLITTAGSSVPSLRDLSNTGEEIEIDSGLKATSNMIQSALQTDERSGVDTCSKTDNLLPDLSENQRVDSMGKCDVAEDSISLCINKLCEDLSEDECSAAVNETFQTMALKIDTQNNIINNLKDRINEKASKYPKTLCEDNEIRNLNVCIQAENEKLHNLLRRVLYLQGRYPNRKWTAMQLATTYMEDNASVKLNISRLIGDIKVAKDSESDFKCSMTYSSERTSKTCSVDCHLHSNLIRTFPSEKRKVYKFMEPEKDPHFKRVRHENRCDFSLDPKKRLKHHQLSCGFQRIKRTDQVRLNHGKVNNIHKKLPGVNSMVPGSGLSVINKSESSVGCTKELVNVISGIHDMLDGNKMQKRDEREDNNICQNSDDSVSILCKECKCHQQRNDIQKVSVAEYEDLKSRYCHLLEEFSQKEREVSRLRATVSNLNDGSGTAKQVTVDISSGEVHLLRMKLKQYQEDNEDFKSLLGEQARQIDEYRVKYMNALQKVEEQRCLSQRMNIDNKTMQDQINNEIQRVTHKFNRQLKEYIHLPQLLENEQIKLAECCREKNNIEMKLRLVCREYKSWKNAFDEKSHETKPDPDQFQKLSDELADLKQQYELLKMTKDDVSLKYDETRQQLDVMRAESAKVICRLKERSAMNQTMLQRRIDELEKDMAKCKAAACLSMADRDAVVRDMQAQLNCMALNFDSSQKQIKTLKDHNGYLSNGKANTTVGCCETNKVCRS